MSRETLLKNLWILENNLTNYVKIVKDDDIDYKRNYKSLFIEIAALARLIRKNEAVFSKEELDTFITEIGGQALLLKEPDIDFETQVQRRIALEDLVSKKKLALESLQIEKNSDFNNIVDITELIIRRELNTLSIASENCKFSNLFRSQNKNVCFDEKTTEIFNKIAHTWFDRVKKMADDYLDGNQPAYLDKIAPFIRSVTQLSVDYSSLMKSESQKIYEREAHILESRLSHLEAEYAKLKISSKS